MDKKNEITESKKNFGELKVLFNQDNVKNKFEEILGKKAPQFMASVLNTVNSNESLKKCSPPSLIAAATVAATFDLPIDGNLGFAAIIPYKKYFYDDNGNRFEKWLPQFQIMTKGFIQMAIRTGQYEKISVSEVYEDELISFNPIKGECEFVEDFMECKQRESGEKDKIVGYYAWFKLKSGYAKELFMTKTQVLNHAKTYSQAYKYDIEKGKKNSIWSTDFDVMARKTVLKSLLRSWGIMSIEYINPFEEDQKIYDENGEGKFLDNQESISPEEDFSNPFKKNEEIIEAAEDDLRELDEFEG